MDIGINENERKKISDGLSRLLADTYTLYLKTHNYQLERYRSNVSDVAFDVRAAI